MTPTKIIAGIDKIAKTIEKGYLLSVAPKFFSPLTKLSFIMMIDMTHTIIKATVSERRKR